MALKDLIAEKGALDEAAIERVVNAFIRYDVEAKEISFLQPFARLSNKAKILVYLVALQGWKFVVDEPPPSDARPADIEAATGIPGGSLRPTLRGLCDSHVISERNSRYVVRGSSLSLIEAEVKGGEPSIAVLRGRATSRKVKRYARKEANDAEAPFVAQTEPENATEIVNEKRQRNLGSKTGNIAAIFERMIDEGYFDEPRTLAEVQSHFRKQAIIIPQTSLPGYFLGAVRKGRLTRDETNSGGKVVWAYKASKKAP